jgi:hypothetical protein
MVFSFFFSFSCNTLHYIKNSNLCLAQYGAPPPQAPGSKYPTQAPPMQAPGYVQGPIPTQPPAQQIVIVQGSINYGKHPMTMTCPHCQSQIQTSIRSEPGPLGK